MKIIKHGKSENTLPRFTCEHCGCEFECDSSEYWCEQNVLCSYPPQHTAYSSCPCCHKVCKTFVTAQSNISSSITTATNDKNEYDKTANAYIYTGEQPKVTFK